MANINPTTPQLRLVKDWLDSYLALDIKRIEPLITNDYSFKSYPKVADHPDETKGLHAEKWGAVFSVLSKSEVSTLQRGSTFKFTNLYPPPLGRCS